MRELSSAGSVTAEANIVVLVPPATMSSWVVVTTVSVDAALAVAIGAPSAPTLVGAPVTREGRSLGGFPNWDALWCRPWRAMTANDRDQSL